MHLTLMQQELEGSKSEDKRRSKDKNKLISKDQILEGKTNHIQAKQVHKKRKWHILSTIKLWKILWKKLWKKPWKKPWKKLWKK